MELKNIYKISPLVLLFCNTNAMQLANAKVVQSKQTSIPIFGIGSAKLSKEQLLGGLANGLRLIDTAKAYKSNEAMVGEALHEAYKLHNIPQKDVTVITKLCEENLTSSETLKKAVMDSIAKIGKTPAFFLIHAPYPKIQMLKRLHELESMKKEGIIKEWGVSNFDIEHLKFLAKNGLTPALNQVEFHPNFQRNMLHSYCKQNNILLQAYRPLNQQKATEIDSIKEIAKQRNISAAQLIYSWLAQQGIAITTKVSSDAHQREYANSGLINLSQAEITLFETFDKKEDGRTCTVGGWFVPFTSEIINTWQS